MNHEAKEVEKLKVFLTEILLNDRWKDGLEDYKWYPQYKSHLTYAGYLHKRGYIKYAPFKSGGMYRISVRGRSWLDKQQGEQDGTNK